MSPVDQLAVRRTVQTALEATYEPTALVLPEGLSYERWGQIMATVFTMERGVNWWVGDGLNYGEHAYGEKYTQAIEATGRRLQSLMNMASVAGRIAPERRRSALSWSCHRAVAYLEPAEQDRLLEEAERKGWGSREIEEAVAAGKKAIPPAPEEPEQSTRSGEILPAEPEATSAATEEQAAQLEEEHEYGAAPELDVHAELERALEETQRLQAVVDTITASDDLASEVKRWSEKYARLEGRVQQLQTTANEAQRQAKYQGEVLKKIRTALGVGQTQQIIPALEELKARAGA